jgi:hypothetical protein
MEITPLFHEDLDALKCSLRLSGSDTCGDVSCVIQDCVRAFKVWVFQRVGPTMLAEIQGYTETDDPTTSEEARRLAAKVLEVKWVWCCLLDKLQVMFADASGAAYQEFNDQGVWRQMGAEDLAAFKRRCRDEVEQLICFVTACEDDATDGVLAFDGTPDYIFAPTGSAWPCTARPFYGNFIGWPTLLFDEHGYWHGCCHLEDHS